MKTSSWNPECRRFGSSRTAYRTARLFRQFVLPAIFPVIYGLGISCPSFIRDLPIALWHFDCSMKGDDI